MLCQVSGIWSRETQQAEGIWTLLLAYKSCFGLRALVTTGNRRAHDVPTVRKMRNLAIGMFQGRIHQRLVRRMA